MALVSEDVLNHDILTVIMGFLDFNSISSLVQMNTTANKAVSTYLTSKVLTYKIGLDFSLYRRQSIALIAIKNYQGAMILHAPPSFGKTLVGLYRAVELANTSEHYVLIVVSPKTLTTWIGQIKTFFPKKYNRQNPDKSQFLVYNPTSHKKHALYLRPWMESNRLGWHSDTEDEDEEEMILEKRVILCSMHNTLLRTLSDKASHLIVDEPQIGKWYSRCSINGGMLSHSTSTVLFLTAEMNYKWGKWNKKVTRSINFGFGSFSDSIPEVKYSHNIIRYQERMDNIGDMVLNHEKTVLFFPSDTYIHKNSDNYKLITEWCVKNDVKVYKLVKSLKPIELFQKWTKKAILLVNTRTATEGVNMIGDAVVIMNPLNINPSRLFQSISRLVRVSNPYKTVSCLLLDTNVENSPTLSTLQMSTRIRMYKERKYIHRCVDINFPILGWRLQILIMKGYPLKDLSVVDIILLGTCYKVSSSRYTKWYQNKSKALSSKVMRDVIGYKLDISV